jgi:hypothetical protein
MDLPFAAFIRARLRMLPSAEGGRRRPISSGYHPNCWIGRTTADGEREYNDAVIYLESADEISPGEDAVVRIQPVFPDYWTEVDVGSEIEVCEGSRVVGLADVVDLYPAAESETGG